MPPAKSESKLFQICPDCGGTGQVPDERFGDARTGCGRSCRRCRMERVVEIEPHSNRLTAAEEQEAQRLYQELCEDIASGDHWGLTKSAVDGVVAQIDQIIKVFEA